MAQQLNVWDGGAWNPTTSGYVWDGATWQSANAYFWDGSSWEQFLFQLTNSQTVTVGSYSSYPTTISGYDSTSNTGSISPGRVKVFEGYKTLAIEEKLISTSFGALFFVNLSVAGTFPKSTFNTLTIGSTPFNSNSAGYSSNSTVSSWIWQVFDGGIFGANGTNTVCTFS